MHLCRTKIWPEPADLCDVGDDFRAGMNPARPLVCLCARDTTCEPEGKLYQLAHRELTVPPKPHTFRTKKDKTQHPSNHT